MTALHTPGADGLATTPRLAARLRTADGREVQATLVRLTVGADGVRVRWRLAPTGWQTLLATGSLGLLDGGFDAGAAAAMVEAGDAPVHVDARLRPALVAALGATDDAIAANLLTGLVGGERAWVRGADAWLATEVTQALDLPDELDGARVSLGFRTRWADGRAALTAGMPTMLGTARSWLEAETWPYEDVGDERLELAATRDGRSWPVFVQAHEDSRRLTVSAIFPAAVAPARRAEVAVWLATVNDMLAIGAWGMDPDDGTLRFRAGLDATDAPFDAAHFEALFATVMSTMDQLWDELVERAG